MKTPQLDRRGLATAQDLMDQLRLVECRNVHSLERVVVEYEAMVRRWPRSYRVPCARPPASLRIQIDPEGLLDLLNQTHEAWRSVCRTRTTAWPLALFLVATRLEVERVIAHQLPSTSHAWEADETSSWGGAASSAD